MAARIFFTDINLNGQGARAVTLITGSTGLTLSSEETGTKSKIYFGSSQVTAFDETNNWLGIGTPSPTHPLTIPYSNNGIALYNTLDQTINYERLAIRWSSNMLNIGVEAGGTGTYRDIIVGRTIGEGMYVRAANSASGRLNANYNNVTFGSVFATTGTITSTSDGINLIAALNTINESSVGGYNAFYASVYEQALGTGVRNLYNFGINTAAANAGTHRAVFVGDRNGYSAVNASITSVSTTDATQTTLQTVSCSTAARTYVIQVIIAARCTGGTSGTVGNAASYKIRGTYKNVGGTVSMVGSQLNSETYEDVTAWDATMTISGTNVLVRVTGAAATNITWQVVEIKVYSI